MPGLLLVLLVDFRFNWGAVRTKRTRQNRTRNIQKQIHSCSRGIPCTPFSIIYQSLFIFIFIFLTVACSQQTQAEERNTIVYKYAQNIEKGKLIDGSVIKGAWIPRSQAPEGAIDDGNIALGRKLLRAVEAGQIIVFRDCFKPEQLQMSLKIDAIQGTRLTREEAAEDKSKPYNEVQIKAIFCRHKIQKGQVIEPSDVTMKSIPVMQLPASQAVDIWTVYKRTALHDIEANERLQLEDVIPVDQMFRLKESLSKS